MGTNSTKIYQKAAGVILHQKNMIAMVKKKEPLALGDEAYSMYEKAPKNIEVKTANQSTVLLLILQRCRR